MHRGRTSSTTPPSPPPTAPPPLPPALDSLGEWTALTGGRGQVSAGEEEVWDSGCGIETGQASSIWAAFERGDSTDTRRYGGLGLALALVRTTVAAHAGSLAVASQREGAGRSGWTRVSLLIPHCQPPPDALFSSLEAVRGREWARGGREEEEGGREA